MDCVKLAGEAVNVQKAFDQLGNASLLDDLRKSTEGTISDLDLMKKAVAANNFGSVAIGCLECG